MDWSRLFVPSGNLLELILRGTVMYLAVLAILRLLRREAGELSRADLLVLLLVADAAQNGMADDYHSITEGLVLVATIFGWNHFLNWLSFRSEAVPRLLEPPPLLVVRNGRVLRRNLHAELLTEDELEEPLRQQGVASLAEVRRCYIESDGKLSVLRADRAAPPKPKARVR